MQLYKTHHTTPLGVVEIIGSSDAIAAVVCVEGSDIKQNVANVRSEAVFTDSPPAVLTECARQLDEYFAGRRRDFSVPLAPVGSSFECRVWSALQEIPFGKVVSYSELSGRLGDKKVIRAAAAANGRNPVWILIPCHRVIGKNGDLTGYAGGLWRKQALLELEGALPQERLL